MARRFVVRNAPFASPSQAAEDQGWKRLVHVADEGGHCIVSFGQALDDQSGLLGGTNWCGGPAVFEDQGTGFWQSFEGGTELYSLCGSAETLSSFTAWVAIPAVESHELPPWQSMLQGIREMCGWSRRDVAEVLGTSHTTVGKLESGSSPTPRSMDAVGRIEPVYAVIRRLYLAARKDVDSLHYVLGLSSAGSRSAFDLLVDGDYDAGYSAALRGLKRLRGSTSQKLRPSDATAELP